MERHTARRFARAVTPRMVQRAITGRAGVFEEQLPILDGGIAGRSPRVEAIVRKALRSRPEYRKLSEHEQDFLAVRAYEALPVVFALDRLASRIGSQEVAADPQLRRVAEDIKWADAHTRGDREMRGMIYLTGALGLAAWLKGSYEDIVGGLDKAAGYVALAVLVGVVSERAVALRRYLSERPTYLRLAQEAQAACDRVLDDYLG